ncbi:hypothetical protein N0V90_008221 [Kalmusia sp. IMI 367209]|nr:hypothetical protein N0V90_008221 [Kalmusia sp. IMI 367209]
MATPSQNEKKIPVPQRAFKPNPAVQTRDAATKRRRDMFFKRVQKDRDDKKWDARGEQIQRLDYISEHKRWEAEKTREAPQFEHDAIEYELEEFASSMPRQDFDEVDYILEQEEHELQELIASMEREEQDNASQHYGSDDEDYDELFMEYTSALELQQGQQQQIEQHTDNSDADAMDMS